MKRVSEKVALVTGAASGLGRADALALAREGALVVVSDLNEEAGQALAKDIDGAFVRQDVRSEEDWAKAVGLALSRFGRLDVLVNNAGIVVPADIETATLEQIPAAQRNTRRRHFPGLPGRHQGHEGQPRRHRFDHQYLVAVGGARLSRRHHLCRGEGRNFVHDDHHRRPLPPIAARRAMRSAVTRSCPA